MNYPGVNKITKQYWTDSDFIDLEKTKTIQEVCCIAMRIVSRMPQGIGQVCGPITTGGIGSIEFNLEYLNYNICELQEKGIHLFDQMPYEETFHRIINNQSEVEKSESILEDFYKPLFIQKKIKTLYFVKGWESSYGANWEYQKAKELGIDVVFL